MRMTSFLNDAVGLQANLCLHKEFERNPDYQRGRQKVCILTSLVGQLQLTESSTSSALESAVRRHAAGSSGGAFSVQGHTLGGGSSKSARPISTAAPGFWANLDPSAKGFIILLGAYILFWYSS